MEAYMEALPVQLRMRRAGLKMSQEALAERCGCSVTAIQTWESGERMPTLTNAVALADIFECSLDDLIQRTPRAE